MRHIVVVAALLGAVACHRDPERAPPPAASVPHGVSPPIRGAAGDSDLRVMLAEMASAKACEMIRGKFIPLLAPDRAGVTSGVLWIRGCDITREGAGAHLLFAIDGFGWQWTDRTQHKAGGTFVVRQYVKFGVRANVRGSLDLAYDRATHVVDVWFSPSETPQIALEPIRGDVDVDRKGLWSNVIGSVSSWFGSSPDSQGEHQVKKEGTQQFESQLGSGLTLAIDLCTGYQRFTLGRPQKGSLGAPLVGESKQVPLIVEPGGLVMFGPHFAQNGMTIDLQSNGPVRVGLACADTAAPAADAFVHDRPQPPIPTLAQTVVNGRGRLHVAHAKCQVVVVARSVAPREVVLSWRRPVSEEGRSTGGPLVQCKR